MCEAEAFLPLAERKTRESVDVLELAAASKLLDKLHEQVPKERYLLNSFSTYFTVT